jgi:hypothetical protein
VIYVPDIVLGISATSSDSDDTLRRFGSHCLNLNAKQFSVHVSHNKIDAVTIAHWHEDVVAEAQEERGNLKETDIADAVRVHFINGRLNVCLRARTVLAGSAKNSPHVDTVVRNPLRELRVLVPGVSDSKPLA